MKKYGIFFVCFGFKPNEKWSKENIRFMDSLYTQWPHPFDGCQAHTIVSWTPTLLLAVQSVRERERGMAIVIVFVLASCLSRFCTFRKCLAVSVQHSNRSVNNPFSESIPKTIPYLYT